MDSDHRFRMKILLFTSDEADWQGIKHHLDSWDVSAKMCRHAVRTFAALVAAADEGAPFDAVIVDQGQLDMDSRQFAISVRSDPALQYLSLIYIGSNLEDPLAQQLYTAGYTKLLPKPLDKTLLYEAIHSISTNPRTEPRVVRLLDRYSSRKTRQPLNILLAEIDRNEQHRVRSILRRAGHHVFVVDDGARVLDALDAHRFDIAVVSFQLKEVTGLEAFKLYRFTHLDQPCIPFLMLLDKPTAVAAGACEEAGVNAFLSKFAESKRLLEMVEKTVQSSSMETASHGGANTIYASPQHPRAVTIDGITLDLQRLKELEQLGGGTEFLHELIENFDQENKKLLTEMTEAAQAGKVSVFRDFGHAIKDSAGSLGAVTLYQLGIRAIKQPPDEILNLMWELRICCQNTYKALQYYLAEYSNSASG